MTRLLALTANAAEFPVIFRLTGTSCFDNFWHVLVATGSVDDRFQIIAVAQCSSEFECENGFPISDKLTNANYLFAHSIPCRLLRACYCAGRKRPSPWARSEFLAGQQKALCVFLDHSNIEIGRVFESGAVCFDCLEDADRAIHHIAISSHYLLVSAFMVRSSQMVLKRPPRRFRIGQSANAAENPVCYVKRGVVCDGQDY